MDETQLQIVSDLHLEAPAAYDVFNITPRAPYLALLGDIGYAKDDGLFDFLRRQLANFRAVFFVFGNHEPYYSNWAVTKSKVKRFEEEMNVSFQKGEVAENSCFSIKGAMTFLRRSPFSDAVYSPMLRPIKWTTSVLV